MKKWVITIFAAVVSLALALTVHSWAPRLLSFVLNSHEPIERLNTFAELISKLVMWPAAAILFIFGLWQRKKDVDAREPSHANIQTGGVRSQSNASVAGDVVAGSKTVFIQGDAVSRDKKIVQDGDLVEGDKYVITHSQPVLTSPHQLPPPPADFTGRTAELHELRAAIEKSGVHISGIQGQGGIGKTALALKLATELSPNFPDAQIYLDLKGASEKPLTTSEAMAHIVRTFHPKAECPEKEEELSPLYLNVLHNKRALILIDNAKDAAHVKSLVPPAGCILLVTSRYRFTLPGLRQKNLDTLPPEDAKKLLLLIAPRIDGEATAIAKLCGYLPLALRQAATAIAERNDLPVADYCRKLADEKTRLQTLAWARPQTTTATEPRPDESVEASVALSYNLLDPQTQASWRMLAVFPDTFAASAVAVVWDTGVDAAKERLSRLLQFSMLEWTDTTKRYRMHDLMRDFARQRMTTAESDDAALRHTRHYGAILRKVDNLYLEGGGSIMHGLELFDLELENIQAGQRWAAAHAAEDREAATLCSDYPDWGAFVLLIRQHPRQQIRWREAALGAARQLKDRNTEGVHLGSLGQAYHSLGDHRRAIDYHEKALVIFREIGDHRSESTALGSLGLVYHSLGDYRRAIDYYEKELDLAQQIREPRSQGTALSGLGREYARLGDHRRGIEYDERALAILREIGDRRGQSTVLGNMGVAYSLLGDYRRAIDYYEQQLELTHEIGDQLGAANALFNQSVAQKKLGDRQKAIQQAEAALKTFEEIEHPDAVKVRQQLDFWRNR